MTDDSFQQDVLNELGDDKLAEIAGLLGTDAAGAQDVVASTADAFAGGLTEKAQAATPEEADEVRAAFAEASEPPLQGVATLGGMGGMLGGGMMAGVLGKLAKPVANAVARKTGLPAASVSRAIEIALPVVVAVVTKRATERRNPGGPTASAAPGTAGGTGGAAGAGGAGGAGGGLGDLLGQVLGGGKR
ncbi:DUF937 domain-containing protein [Streptomyces sp. NPDC091272]|uniref:DUF937 domain-containing protein n=1 Tax=Streptomyces sp. NPDC091272 TaxID=3365981 RepID=UPI0037FC044B